MLQVLSEVLLHLQPNERLSSSLTCRRWATAVSASRLLDDVTFVTSGADLEAGDFTAIHSDRQYRSVKIVGGNVILRSSSQH